MSVATVLQHVAGARARVTIEGGHIRLRGPREALTPDLRREVTEHKAELLALLTSEDRAVRERLKAIAGADNYRTINPGVVDRLSVDDLAECRLLSDETLHAYLVALTDTHERMKGKAPWGWTAPAMCAHCGPVWLHPDVVQDLHPIPESRYRYALACPWCPEHAEGRLFARPHVTCASCARFAPNENNPDAGLGRCVPLASGQWPLTSHACAHFRVSQSRANTS